MVLLLDLSYVNEKYITNLAYLLLLFLFLFFMEILTIRRKKNVFVCIALYLFAFIVHYQNVYLEKYPNISGDTGKTWNEFCTYILLHGLSR